jgi:hypothetical protein
MSYRRAPATGHAPIPSKWYTARRVKLRRTARRLSILTVLVMGLILLPSSGFTPHRLSALANVAPQNMVKGFDKCDAAGTDTMGSWWLASPYVYVGIYIGGDNRACANTKLNSGWRETVSDQGWSFIPFYVGLQAPCTSYAHTFSSNPASAYSQGVSTANAAISTAQGLGFSNSIIYFDLEPFNTGNSSCLNAAESFVSGWDAELTNNSWGSGLFGAALGSGMADMYGLGSPYGPADADIGDWSNAYDSPWGIPGIPDSYWEYDHRIHQYASDGSCETWGGICLTVDRQCAIGPTAEAKEAYSENSEPSGTNEGQGPAEDVPPC